MRAWFDNLAPRERMILLAGGVAAALIVGYWVVMHLHTDAATLRTAVESKQRLLLDIARLEGTPAGGAASAAQGTGQTLVVVVDNTAKAHGLQLARARPNGPSGVDVTFQGVPFDVLVDWLMTLHGSYAVDVESASLSSAREQGLVNGQLSLHRL
jgi:general secretion pathway protein M